MKIIKKMILAASVLAVSVANAATDMNIKYMGQGHSILTPTRTAKYLLLPIEEASSESRISVYEDNQVKENINVRLAKDKVDYYMPYELEGAESFYIHAPFTGSGEKLHNTEISETGIWAKHIKLSDTYDVESEQYRPSYHFTPKYGWMNDPNGMFYKDGVYHLYYQYNPYASVWGNMSWGHATSRDLIHWEHQPVALRGDALGAIFSGSCVVDKNNAAGFGKDAVVAYYTSASERQMQSMAVSRDNGLTFDKYKGNPIVTSSINDFRDPKVVWNKKGNNWIMVLAAGQEMQFYSSVDLKEWKYESSFGGGYGNHDGVWECPDLFELPVEGTDKSKWVLICNINPGGPFGGSATQYFVGDFDGKKFVVDVPCKTKWMDYGRDHYATVTWSDAPDNRCVAIPWMSNWQYANVVPTKMFRSANGLPRDLKLFEYAGDVYLKSVPVPEIKSCMKNVYTKGKVTFGLKEKTIHLPKDLLGAYAIEMEVFVGNAQNVNFTLANSKGEKVVMCFDGKTFSFDRKNSGLTSFSEQFASVTSSSVYSDGKVLKLTIFVDNSSVEVFGNDGRFVQTNLVFPSEPYDRIVLSTKDKKAKISNLKIFKIEL